MSGLSGEQIAALSTKPVVRSGPLAKIDGGAMVPIGWESAAIQATVISAQGSGAGTKTPGVCTLGSTGKTGETTDTDSPCSIIRRGDDGWLAQRRWEDRESATRAGAFLVEAPRAWVIEAPLSTAVVTYAGVEKPTMIHDLGHGYLAVTALVPFGGPVGFLPGVQAWGIDDHGVVVAYSED